MEEYDVINSFLKNIFFYLTGTHSFNDEIKIFRSHNNKLDTCGDISFPLNINAWTKHIDTTASTEGIPIFNLINEHDKNSTTCDFNDLIKKSANWNISISNCQVDHEKVNLFIDRKNAFKYTINKILDQNEKYGFSKINYKSRIDLQTESTESNLSSLDLTHLRIKILKEVIVNLLRATSDSNLENSNAEVMYVSNKSNSNHHEKNILCGVVISNKFGKKDTQISAQDYYSKRTVDMRLMAQHKYGVRVNSEPGWAEFFEKLGSAAVTIDLLNVKPSRPLVINIDTATTHSKGASFILYNCARLNAIFKQFEKKVASGAYPPLPDVQEIDFSLLNQPEEWEILFVYLMQYPQTVRSCVRDIEECKTNVHNLCSFLDSLCGLFSVYYRRVRILTEPRTHLFPVLYSRLYLLKAVQQVLHNALALLNIPPVKQM